MNVVLFGATGMVGAGTLVECLAHPDVERVLVVGRRSCGVRHEKLEELVHEDFLDFSSVRPRFSGYDTCFYCVGVSSAGMSEDAYRRITFDMTLEAARALIGVEPGMVFCYVSAAGADSSEGGRVMWARVRGAIENALTTLPFRSVYALRPAYIQPLKGVRSRTRLYSVLYTVAAPMYPILRRLAPRWVTTTELLGLAMIRLARDGAPRTILESEALDQLGRAEEAALASRVD